MVLRSSCLRHGRSMLRCSNIPRASRKYANEASPSEFSKMLSSIEARANELEKNQKSLRAEIYETMANRISATMAPAVTPPDDTKAEQASLTPKTKPEGRKDYEARLGRLRKTEQMGSDLEIAYDPAEAFRKPPTANELTLPMLLAAQTHLGHATSLWNPHNSNYIFGIRDGIHIISLEATLAYLRRAARVVREVAVRGGMILFVGTRKGQEEIVVRAAKRSKGYHVFERWIPGSLTNGPQILGHCRLQVVNAKDEDLPEFTKRIEDSQLGHPVLRPDLVVCLNPMENEVCLHECALNTIPTIGVIDTDADATHVTYPIPANDDSLRSITLIAGVLANAGAEGQGQRMGQAELGNAAYSTEPVSKFIKYMDDVNAMASGQKRPGRKDEPK